MLSYGAKQLAEAKAVLKNLTDVETLGATSAINTVKTGTLTMNEMMVSVLHAGGSWFTPRWTRCASPARPRPTTEELQKGVGMYRTDRSGSL